MTDDFRYGEYMEWHDEKQIEHDNEDFTNMVNDKHGIAKRYESSMLSRKGIIKVCSIMELTESR